MKKLFAVLAALLLIWLGWLLTHPEQTGSPATDNQTGGSHTPAIQTVPSVAPDEQQAAIPSAVTEPATGSKTSLGSQQLTVTKKPAPAGTQENLSEYTYHLQKEEKKGVQILPGMQVKNRTVQIEMDKDKEQWLEIERHPDNSNSDYQIMLKKKF